MKTKRTSHMYVICGSLIIVFLGLALSCGRSLRSASTRGASQRSVIKVTENKKYKLEAVFSGYDLELKNGTVKVIDSMKIRSKGEGKEMSYLLANGPSESDADAYFTDVWSPDDELLLLPLNRFEGFCIIRSKEALDSLQEQKCTDSISVSIRTPPRALWHGFEKWSGNESFVFKAGLYGDHTRLEYEISNGRLTSLDSNFKALELEGKNSKGKILVVGP